MVAGDVAEASQWGTLWWTGTRDKIYPCRACPNDYFPP
jgi:hypothetical protein